MFVFMLLDDVALKHQAYHQLEGAIDIILEVENGRPFPIENEMQGVPLVFGVVDARTVRVAAVAMLQLI